MNLTADQLALVTVQQRRDEAERHRLTHPEDAAPARRRARRSRRHRIHLPHLRPQPLH